MKAWVLVGVVLVGVSESEGSLEAWLRQIGSNDHQDSSIYLPRLPLQHSNVDTDISSSNTDIGTSSSSSSVEIHTEQEKTRRNPQDLHYVPDGGVGLRGDENLGKRRTRRSNTGSYGHTGLEKKEHIFSILALVVFASFLAYLVYFLVTEYKEKEEEEKRALHPRDDVLTNLLRDVITGVGKWSLLDYLSEGVEDFDVPHW